MNTPIPILFAVPDDHVVDRKSSISQHTDKLGYWKKGRFIPLEFDRLDYIDCNHIESHRSTLSNGTDLGYDYPTGSCTVYSNNYLYGDIKEKVMKALPSWYGVGFYEAFVDKFTDKLLFRVARPRLPPAARRRARLCEMQNSPKRSGVAG